MMLQGKGVLRSIDAEDAVCSIEDLKTGETASYRVSDNAANMIESIPTGVQVSFRYFAPQLEDELASLSEKLRSTRTAAKEKSLFITDNYEVYIGKGYMTSEKLQALADIVRSGAASNISDAIAVYKSQEETAK